MTADNFLCFVCGCHSDDWRHIKSQPDNTGHKPFFPFLLTQDPAAGSLELGDSGSSCVCILCATLLQEQWNIYEQGNIHRQKRIYWMKRPQLTRPFTSRECSLLKKLVVMESQDNIAENGVKPFGDWTFASLKNNGNYLSRVLTKSAATNEPSYSISSSNGCSTLRKAVVNDEEIACYLCNERLLFSERKFILTDAPPQRALTTRFYPCFHNIKPPHATKNNIKNGDIFACTSCDDHLRIQWDKYEKAAVPITFRIYTLRSEDSSFCYCCGSIFRSRYPSLACDICFTSFCQLCRQPNKCKDKITVLRFSEKDEFYSLMKLFPDKIRNTTACDKCMSFLLLQKNSFDQQKVAFQQRKYSLPTVLNTVTSYSPKQIVCYLCGESYKSNNKVYYLFSEKRMGSDENTPFFPLLKSLNPAEGANIMTKESVIFTCRFCYHNLVAQWNWYELTADSRSKESRNYSLNICCVVCTKSVARPKVRVIGKSQFPFLPELPRDPRCIILDNFDCAVVCNPCERTLVMQWLDYEKRSVITDKREYRVAGRVFKSTHGSASKSNPAIDSSLTSEYTNGKGKLGVFSDINELRSDTKVVNTSQVAVTAKPAISSQQFCSSTDKPLHSYPSDVSDDKKNEAASRLLLQAAAASASMYPMAALQQYLLNPATASLSTISQTQLVAAALASNPSAALSPTLLSGLSEVPYVKQEPNSPAISETSLVGSCSLHKALSLIRDDENEHASENGTRKHHLNDGTIDLSVSSKLDSDDDQPCDLSRSSCEPPVAKRRQCNSPGSMDSSPEPKAVNLPDLCRMSWEEVRVNLDGCSDDASVRKLEIEHCKLQLLHDNYRRKLVELQDAEIPFTSQLQVVNEVYSKLSQT